ncbi:MAG: hypothetical protein L0H93_19935 [Nocardioides sp.]|nr:hypothetical protein [Nocardioides sp.]
MSVRARLWAVLLSGALVLVACVGESDEGTAEPSGGQETSSSGASAADVEAENQEIIDRLTGAVNVRTIARNVESWPRRIGGEGRNPVPHTSEYLLLSARDELGARTEIRLVQSPFPSAIRDNTPGEVVPRKQSDKGGPGTPVFNDDHVVWMTDTEPDLGVELWELYAHDRASGETTMLAKARLLGGDVAPPPDPGYTDPVLLDEHVYWAQVGGAFKDLHVDIYGCEIADCTPERVARNAAYPYRIDDHTLAYVEGGKFSRKGERSTPVTMVVQDMNTGAVEEYETGEDVTVVGGFAASHRYLVWTRGLPGKGRQPERAEWLVRDTGERGHVDSRPRRGGFGYPEATDTFVVWGEVTGDSPDRIAGYLIRPGDDTLYKVGNSSGLYGFDVDGRRLQWREQKPGGGPDEIRYVTGLVPPAP